MCCLLFSSDLRILTLRLLQPEQEPLERGEYLALLELTTAFVVVVAVAKRWTKPHVARHLVAIVAMFLVAVVVVERKVSARYCSMRPRQWDYATTRLESFH